MGAGQSRGAPVAADGAEDGAQDEALDGAEAEALDYEVVGGSAFAELVLTLRPGQSVLADASALQSMREGVEPGRAQLAEGILSAAKRAVAGESAFLVRYRGLPGTPPQARRLTLASALPGDVLPIDMRPGTTYKLSRGAFLAASTCVALSGRLNWRGALVVGQEEGAFLPLATCRGPGPGTLFVAGYGAHVKHELAAGETLVVDNGLFLACPGEVTYEVVRLGRSLASAVLGGEGLGMRFKGPCTVYTQSRNLNDLAAQLATRLPGRRWSLAGGGSAPPKPAAVTAWALPPELARATGFRRCLTRAGEARLVGAASRVASCDGAAVLPPKTGLFLLLEIGDSRARQAQGQGQRQGGPAAKVALYDGARAKLIVDAAAGTPALKRGVLLRALHTVRALVDPSSALHRHLLAQLGERYARSAGSALERMQREAARAGKGKYPEPYASALRDVFGNQTLDAVGRRQKS